MGELLARIPAVVWSGIVAAMITLFGVWLQSRSHYKRQQEQLQHDSDQRRTEREMALRREVYLGAAEGAAKLQEYLGKFADTKLPQQDHGALLADSGAALSRVHLIGSIETLKAFRDIQNCFSRSALDLLERKALTNYVTTRISEVEARINELVQTRGQLLELIQTTKDSKDGKPLELLIPKFEEINSTIEQHLSTVEHLRKDLEDRQKQLMVDAVSASAELGSYMGKAVITVRRELGLELDEQEYLGMSEESTNLARERIRQLIERLTDEANKLDQVQ